VADTGDVRFAIDLSAGIVHVTVRPPLVLESGAVTAPMPVLVLLDVAAQTTLELNKQSRAMMASVGRDLAAQVAS
jgi:hypothetical protein